MPLPAVLDDFNREDETPLDNGGAWAGPIWASDGQARLQGNRANGSASGWVDSYWTDALPEDQVCAVRVAATVTSRFISPYVRIQNPATGSLNGYTVLCSTSNGAWNLLRVKAEAEASLGTGTQALAVGGYVILEAEGDTLRAIWAAPSTLAETLIIEEADPSPVTGEGFIGFAMLSSGTSLAIDDFSGGAIGGEEPEAVEFDDAASGTLGLSGSGVEEAVTADIASGALSLAGVGSDGAATTDSASGSFDLSGVGAEGALGEDGANGAITLTGTGIEGTAILFEDAGSGSLALRGSGQDAALGADSQGGTLTLLGSSVETWHLEVVLPEVDRPTTLTLAAHTPTLTLGSHEPNLTLAERGNLILDPHETEVTLDG